MPINNAWDTTNQPVQPFPQEIMNVGIESFPYYYEYIFIFIIVFACSNCFDKNKIYVNLWVRVASIRTQNATIFDGNSK